MALPFRRLAAPLCVLALLTAACGGGDDGKKVLGGDDTTETTKGSGTSSGAVSSLDGVEGAVIQIVAKGTFAQPSEAAAYEEVSQAGSGSGFIIDPSGIAVTNNHVVTGAASLEVYVSGEDDPVNAKVLGVSECDDLAVIDLEGDDYPYLGWYDGEIDAGLEISVAGFPLGDPEFTLVRGIVAKAKADGETQWSSVDSVIQHDAEAQPGNSGGPIVTSDGKVVGVHFMSYDAGTGTTQKFGISAAIARDVVETMSGGEDVLSLGVNGQAIYDQESGLAGIWVASVKSGGPASEAGIQGGDIIERVEGLPMATDGTMKDYCDVLQSHNADDVLSVQILRFEDGTRYRGEFNGKEIEPFQTIASEVEDTADGTLPTGSSYGRYMPVSDDSGALRVEVPAEWSDVQGTPLVLDDGTELPQIIASTDLAAYAASYDVPGMEFAATVGGDFTTTDMLDAIGPAGECTSAGRQDYDDGAYVGEMEFWEGCGGTGTQVVTIAAGPAGGEFMALLFVQIVSDADIDALDQIIQTFQVITE
ncbi:MAG: S1C family serine protease [Acidimicrobiia bacterium]|nr:S1C family serine protease [Acidimicrobiia bacterium]